MSSDGHKFFGGRCWHCGIKFTYYADILQAIQKQPNRNDLKEFAKCKPRKGG